MTAHSRQVLLSAVQPCQDGSWFQRIPARKLSLEDGEGFRLGGIGSDVTRDPGWMVQANLRIRLVKRLLIVAEIEVFVICSLDHGLRGIDGRQVAARPGAP